MSGGETEDASAGGEQETEEVDKRGDRREKDRGAYMEFGGIGILMLDVWGNQPWRLDKDGRAVAKDEQDGTGFHPRPLLSKRCGGRWAVA